MPFNDLFHFEFGLRCILIPGRLISEGLNEFVSENFDVSSSVSHRL